MDVNQKIDQERSKYNSAAEDLRSSYNKSTKEMKETSDNQALKQSKNYDIQKSKLEDQNLVNNELYSDKTKKAISERQVAFRDDLKKNAEKFDIDRNKMKTSFSDKLSDLSDSYRKSTEENDRFHNQTLRTVDDRNIKSNQATKNEFDKQVERLSTKVKDTLAVQKEESSRDRKEVGRENQANLDNLRSSGQEQKFKEVTRLRNDNENLRTNFSAERDSMTEQQDARIADILKSKNIESDDSQKNFSNLQNNIRLKNMADEEKVKVSHENESKELNKKFTENIRDVQHLSNQKIMGGSEISSLKDENKQLVTSYENRLRAAHVDSQLKAEAVTEKENENDVKYREKLKALKTSNSEDLDLHDVASNKRTKDSIAGLKEKSDSLIDRYKVEVGTTKAEGEGRISKSEVKSKGQLQDQRVEFGKYINTVNTNKLDEISSIKSEFTKEKSNFVEQTKRDVSDEKLFMKDNFKHQIGLKEDMYENKLNDIEKQTNKTIENYENKISQILKRTDSKIETLMANNKEKEFAEKQINKNLFENQERQNQMEIGSLRDKYEGMIGKDRVVNEQQTNRLVQKYEDLLLRERSEAQKEITQRANETDGKFERQFKSSELEKMGIRSQYEQRIENMKLTSIAANGNSKKV